MGGVNTDTYKYDSDADAAAFGGDERCAQGAIVPPDPRSLAQAPPRISSFCVCARAPSVNTPSVNTSGVNPLVLPETAGCEWEVLILPGLKVPCSYEVSALSKFALLRYMSEFCFHVLMATISDLPTIYP